MAHQNQGLFLWVLQQISPTFLGSSTVLSSKKPSIRNFEMSAKVEIIKQLNFIRHLYSYRSSPWYHPYVSKWHNLVLWTRSSCDYRRTKSLGWKETIFLMVSNEISEEYYMKYCLLNIAKKAAFYLLSHNQYISLLYCRSWTTAFVESIWMRYRPDHQNQDGCLDHILNRQPNTTSRENGLES